MLVIKALISNCVGQDFWQGASAHFKQRAASFKAPLSLRVVGFTSEKSFCRLGQLYNSRFCPKNTFLSPKMFYLTIFFSVSLPVLLFLFGDGGRPKRRMCVHTRIQNQQILFKINLRNVINFISANILENNNTQKTL